MSTYIHLLCTSHTPHIRSEELGHRSSFAVDVVALVHRREEVVDLQQRAQRFGADIEWSLPHTEARTAEFLRRHPSCDLELWDEYGNQYCMGCGKRLPCDCVALNKAGAHEA